MKKGSMHKAVNARFAKNLRRLREEHGLSQPQLAERMGIAKSYVSMLETGERDATLNMAAAAAEVFKVTLVEMIT